MGRDARSKNAVWGPDPSGRTPCQCRRRYRGSTSLSKREWQHVAAVTARGIDGNDRRLGKEIEFGCTRPGIGTHRASDDEIAGLELRQHQILGDDIDAVAGRTR